MALDTLGRVWVFGYNEHGQLGMGGTDHIYDETECVDVAVMNTYFMTMDIRIAAIHCGFDFSMCLDDEGRCYLFGSNETGQLGNGSEFEYRVSTPQPLLVEKRTTSASLGSYHCALIDVDNDIWTFGANNNCQCSVVMDPEANIVRPYLLSKQEIGIEERLCVHRVIASHSTTLIIVSNVQCS